MRKVFFAALFAVGLLLWPETALNAARNAMRIWYESVAPALFPFMALMPMLTGPEACAAYERLLGWLMRPLFGLPGAAAPVIVIGMTAGSPAGAVAAVRTANYAGFDREVLERLVCCVCGLSPAFLISGIGASMLGSAADGRLLLHSQIAAQLVMLILTRKKSAGSPAAEKTTEDGGDAVRTAVLGVLKVCGYMILFQIIAAMLARILRNEWAGLTALCLLDLPSGAKAVSELRMSREARLLLLSALTGLGGLCIAAQNLAACRGKGVRLLPVMFARLSAAALMSGATAIQLAFPQGGSAKISSPMVYSSLIAGLLAVPVWIFLENKLFINKRKVSEKPPQMRLKREKIQDVVEKDSMNILYNELREIKKNA